MAQSTVILSMGMGHMAAIKSQVLDNAIDIKKSQCDLVAKGVTSFPEQKQYGFLAVYLNAFGCLFSTA